ncbi:hypothetical protein [Cupriavidus basilensis]|uniref:hypothetical protein n=1 Tax=Cupriavidus basilensis TaxID=68895 RepID=UPI0039F71338
MIGILARTQNKTVANPNDRELLFSSFTNAELHKREVYKILFSLEKKGYVSLHRTDVAEILDVTLMATNLPDGFFSSAQFDKEHRAANELRTLVPRISTLTLDSLLERMYQERGIRVWAS